MINIREKIIEYTILTLLVVTLFVPSTIDVFTNSIVNLLVATIFLFWIINYFPRYTSAINLPLLCLLLYSLLSLIRTCNFHFTLMQIYMFVSCFLLFIMVINIFNKDDAINRFTFFFLFIGGLKIFQVASQYLFENILGNSFCFFLPTKANSNHFAGYLAMVILIGLGVLWFMTVGRSIKLYIILCLLIGPVLMFLTNSRAGMIALVFSFLILLYMKNKKFFILGLLIIPLILIYFLFFSKMGAGFKRGDPYAYERLIIWRDSIQLFSDYPFLGSGLGTFRDYYPRYKSIEGIRTTQYAHNEYLNILVEMGLVGFLIFFWMVVKLFR